MTPNSKKVESYFQQRAEQFDSLYDERDWRYYLNRVLRRGMFDRLRLALRELEGMRDFSVLDVGCGSGRNSALFARAGARRVAGIDLSERMIQLARRFTAEHQVADRCEFLLGDFHAYPFGESFDAVIALGVFDYVEDAAGTLQRMAQLSTHKVMASFPGRSWLRAPLRKLRYSFRGCPLYFYSRNDLNEICRKAELKDYDIVPIASGLFLVARVSCVALGPVQP